jgi:hypothetical protein
MSRHKYRWDDTSQELVEVDLDAPVTPRVELVTGSLYEGARAVDGTLIDTPKRHREYMRRNNLVLAHEAEPVWREAPKRREQQAKASRRETLGRTLYQLENRRHR